MIDVMPMVEVSVCCDALAFEVDERGIGRCSHCGEWCDIVKPCEYCDGEGVYESMYLGHDGEPQYWEQECICKI